MFGFKTGIIPAAKISRISNNTGGKIQRHFLRSLRAFPASARFLVRASWSFFYIQFPSGKSFFPDAGSIAFLCGNEEFFLLARKSINYEKAYLNTLTNNYAD